MPTQSTRSIVFDIMQMHDEAKMTRLDTYLRAMSNLKMDGAWDRFFSAHPPPAPAVLRPIRIAPDAAGLRAGGKPGGHLSSYNRLPLKQAIDAQLSRFHELAAYDPLAMGTNLQLLAMSIQPAARRHPELTSQLLARTRPQTVPSFYRASPNTVQLPRISYVACRAPSMLVRRRLDVQASRDRAL
jgi:hypothetical protein